MRAGDARVGAVATFVGTVRDVNDAASVSTLTLEHYPGMTEKALDGDRRRREARASTSSTRSSSIASASLQPTDQIVLVAVTSAHRGDAFDACRFLMDYLKTRAPFWKKEQHAGRRALGRRARERRRGRRALVPHARLRAARPALTP